MAIITVLVSNRKSTIMSLMRHNFVSLNSDEKIYINSFEDPCPNGLGFWQSDAYLRRFEASVENCCKVKLNEKLL